MIEAEWACIEKVYTERITYIIMLVSTSGGSHEGRSKSLKTKLRYV